MTADRASDSRGPEGELGPVDIYTTGWAAAVKRDVWAFVGVAGMVRNDAMRGVLRDIYAKGRFK